MLRLYWNGEISFSMGTGCRDKEIMTNLANKERVFEITNKTYREILAACIKMKIEAKNGIVFFTATFPFEPTETEAQKIFRNFMKNLKLNYHVETYIWVKERQKSGRIHFHFLADIPYTPIKNLQRCWSNCLKNVHSDFEDQSNSLRLPNSRKFGNLVRDVAQLAKYMGKYLSKSRFEGWEYPACAISKNLYPLFVDITETEALELCRSHKNFIFTDKEFYARTILKNVNFNDLYRRFSMK